MLTGHQTKIKAEINPWHQADADLTILKTGIERAFDFTRQASVLLTAASIKEKDPSARSFIRHLKGEMLFAFSGLAEELAEEACTYRPEIKAFSHQDQSFEQAIDIINTECRYGLKRLSNIDSTLINIERYENPNDDFIPTNEQRIRGKSPTELVTALTVVRNVENSWLDTCSRLRSEEALKAMLPVLQCWKRAVFGLVDSVTSSLNAISHGVELESLGVVGTTLRQVAHNFEPLRRNFEIAGAYSKSEIVLEDQPRWPEIEKSLADLSIAEIASRYMHELERVASQGTSAVAIRTLSKCYENRFLSEKAQDFTKAEKSLQKVLECQVALLRRARHGNDLSNVDISNFDPESLLGNCEIYMPRTAFLAVNMIDELTAFISSLDKDQNKELVAHAVRINQGWTRVLERIDGVLFRSEYLQRMFDANLSSAQTNFLRNQAQDIKVEETPDSADGTLDRARGVVHLMNLILKRGLVARDRCAAAEVIAIAAPALHLLSLVDKMHQ